MQVIPALESPNNAASSSSEVASFTASASWAFSAARSTVNRWPSKSPLRSLMVAVTGQSSGMTLPKGCLRCWPNRRWPPCVGSRSHHVTKRFRKLCAAAGVASVKLHEGGRHTGVSLMHDAGVRDDISMREAGHSDRAVHQR